MEGNWHKSTRRRSRSRERIVRRGGEKVCLALKEENEVNARTTRILFESSISPKEEYELAIGG